MLDQDPVPPTTDLFEQPSRWRVEVIDDLGLRGDDRIAGAATSAGMPQLMRPLVAVLGDRPDLMAGPVLDIGSGLGPLSRWLADRGCRHVVPIDPSATSCAGAHHLFGLRTLRGGATDLAIRDGATGIAISNGTISLVHDLDAAIDELVRVTAPGGLVAVADLLADGDDRVVTGPNTFWTLADVVDALERRGCTIADIACADPGVGDWAAVQSRVTDEIARRCAGRRGYDEWRRDGERIGSLLADGVVAPASVVAAR